MQNTMSRKCSPVSILQNISLRWVFYAVAFDIILAVETLVKRFKMFLKHGIPIAIRYTCIYIFECDYMCIGLYMSFVAYHRFPQSVSAWNIHWIRCYVRELWIAISATVAGNNDTSKIESITFCLFKWHKHTLDIFYIYTYKFGTWKQLFRAIEMPKHLALTKYFLFLFGFILIFVWWQNGGKMVCAWRIWPLSL